METERNEKDLMSEDCMESQDFSVLEEINIEELAVDGICGIY